MNPIPLLPGSPPGPISPRGPMGPSFPGGQYSLVDEQKPWRAAT